jgi:UDP-3-O-[3-hydroxymyristoyl] N-acetylglucosamine deacetylase
MVFTDGFLRIPVSAHSASGYGHTCLGPFATVEHLLAATFAVGLTDLDVVVSGGELPILDGSALPWLEAIDSGEPIDGPPIAALSVSGSRRIEAYGGMAEWGPSEGLSLSVAVAFDDGLPPHGDFSVTVDERSFREEIAWARTWVREGDIGAALAMGRGKGAGHDNTVVYGAKGPTTSQRGPMEAVRHKLLDLVGDLALVGRPICAAVHVERPSHALNRMVASMIVDELAQ